MKSGKVDIRIYAGTVTRCHLRCVDEAGAYHPLDGTLTGQFRLFGIKHDIVVSFDAANERYVLEFDAQSFSPCYGVFELQLVNADSVQLMISGSLECLETLGCVNNGSEYQAQLVDGDKLVMTVIDGAKGDKGDAGDTTPEFLALAAQVNADAIAAEQSADNAQTDAIAAHDSANDAATSANVAAAQASIATSQAADASQAATDAIAAAENAEGQAGIATAQANNAASSAIDAATSAGQAADAVSGLLGANNNWTGTNTFQAPVTLNNASVLAPNVTRTANSLASLVSMTGFPVTRAGNVVSSLGAMPSGADWALEIAGARSLTPFQYVSSVGSVFLTNKAFAVGSQGFLIKSDGATYTIKHATITALTDPITLTEGGTIYTQPVANPLITTIHQVDTYINIIAGGVSTNCPQPGEWSRLYVRRVQTGGSFFMWAGVSQAVTT